LVLTFVAGSAVGIFGYRLYSGAAVMARPEPRRSAEFRKMYLQEMENRLKLNDDQKTRLVLVLDQTQALFRQLNEKHRPEYDAIHQAQVEQINALLSADQQAEYTKLRAERDKRRKAREGSR
jgi:hypothetical protein